MKKMFYLMAFGLACAAGGARPTIADIAQNHKQLDQDTLELVVVFRGWSSSDKPLFGTMLSRSDWTAEDSSGACFVHGWPKGFFPPDNKKQGDTISIKVVVHSQDTSFWLELVQ